MEKKHLIIPIFVPHLGCPNDCIFCNQHNISGQLKQVTAKEVRETVDYYLGNCDIDDTYKEVAFFGGSFTGIDIKIQEELLSAAYEYIKEKKIDSIRISTRPDYINKDILKMLKKYKVKTIELGVQSSNDYILKRAGRGHTFEDVKKASKLIRRHRFTLGHQMMIGLPESSSLDELKTAKDLAKLKPKIMRIYPVLVIKGTKLEEEYKEGNFKPLNVNQAVEICKEVYYYFNKKKINVIRIGLQTTEMISDPKNEESTVVAGPYHEAFRQLVEDGMWYDSILERIKKLNVKVKEIEVVVNPVNINNVSGHKRENTLKLKDTYDVDLKIKQDEKIPEGTFEMNVLKIYKDFLD